MTSQMVGGGTAPGTGRLNRIPELQNAEPMQLLLRAKSAAHDRAQRLYYVRFGAAVVITLVLTSMKILVPGWSTNVATLGVLVTLIDLMVLDPWVKQTRQLAAKFQEAFDCDLYELPWLEQKAGARPSAEEIAEWAGREPLQPWHRDWYAPAVGLLPLPLARIACQRCNVSWTVRMRRRYAGWLGWSGAVILVVAGLLGMVLGAGFTEVGSWVATVSPAWVWALRERRLHREAADASEKLRGDADRLWRAALVAESFTPPGEGTRLLQNEIYDQRRRDQPVIGAAYWKRRDKDEELMRVGVAALVKEYQQAVERRHGSG